MQAVNQVEQHGARMAMPGQMPSKRSINGRAANEASKSLSSFNVKPTQPQGKDHNKSKAKEVPLLLHPIGKFPLDKLTSKDWKSELATFLGLYGNQRSNDFSMVCSETTKTDRKRILYNTFGLIIKDQKLQSISMIKPRHLPRLFELWNARGVSKRTQINYYNTMRYFWRVCGIEIYPIAHYETARGEFTIDRNATYDKSWSGNGVDFDEIHRRVCAIDKVAGRLLLAQKTFGLRKKESICLQPHLADGDDQLFLTRGTKTGRKRTIEFNELESSSFRDVLNELKRELNDKDHLAWKGLTLKQAKAKLAKIVRKVGVSKKELGVTMHGLRHQFAIDQFIALSGMNAPVRGGNIINYRDPVIANARGTVSKALGHRRKHITGAYYGSVLSQSNAEMRAFQRSWTKIEGVLPRIQDLLNDRGIGNLYWIGARSHGVDKGADGYQFVMPPGVDEVVGQSMLQEIAELVEGATGCAADTRTWSSMTANQQVLQEELAVPLFLSISPETYMKQRQQAQREIRNKAGVELITNASAATESQPEEGGHHDDV